MILSYETNMEPFVVLDEIGIVSEFVEGPSDVVGKLIGISVGERMEIHPKDTKCKPDLVITTDPECEKARFRIVIPINNIISTNVICDLPKKIHTYI